MSSSSAPAPNTKQSSTMVGTTTNAANAAKAAAAAKMHRRSRSGKDYPLDMHAGIPRMDNWLTEFCRVLHMPPATKEV
jgi:hypothetical protein